MEPNAISDLAFDSNRQPVGTDGGDIQGGQNGQQSRSSARHCRGGDAPIADDGGRGTEPVLDADIEYDAAFDGLQRQKSMFSVIGMDEPDSGIDRTICVILAFLLVGLLAMIVALLMK